MVPADLAVDLEALAVLAGAATIRLAREDEIDWLFPDCERGAMPPLGPLYRQNVFVEEALADEERIVFNAGTHGDAVVMRYADFASLTRGATLRKAKQGSRNGVGSRKVREIRKIRKVLQVLGF